MYIRLTKILIQLVYKLNPPLYFKNNVTQPLQTPIEDELGSSFDLTYMLAKFYPNQLKIFSAISWQNEDF